MGVATAWTGIGAVTGGVVTVHGLDGLSAGLTQLITGKETRSYSEQGLSKALQKPGVSKENADIYAAYGNAALSMFFTGGAGKLLKFTKAPVKAIPKAKVVPKVNNVAAKGGTSLLKPLGLGSTGRTAAASLTEQLAMKEIMSKPSSGKVLIQTMKDASGRWSGWSKMSNKTAHGVEIHYNALWENGVIKAIDDFKFIGGK